MSLRETDALKYRRKLFIIMNSLHKVRSERRNSKMQLETAENWFGHFSLQYINLLPPVCLVESRIYELV